MVTVKRTGTVRSMDATRSVHTSLLVRECADGSFDYLVGDSAHNPNGWASLPDDLLAEVQWNAPVLHLHDQDDACDDADCEWAGTTHEVK